MRPSNSNSGARHRVNRSLIQTQWPGRLATEFESVSNSLSGAGLSLNRMAASNSNSDATIQARFSGSAWSQQPPPALAHPPVSNGPKTIQANQRRLRNNCQALTPPDLLQCEASEAL
ncbi:hypothetical protein PCANC_17213 [Puccinia coronata f. sp. avenae]|uniref:Uncharacterized protein n=1 Tax=Puccinia coronata f. sp. avenae TaxID=200324 RepID=A0A2N5SG04_9BASI|nr:hypothetical protein PCANC_17213 [Puccinia coronata f. sp. avenae]